MGWLDKFKVAIVSKDPQKISSLIDTMPQFENLDAMQEAFYLIKEAHKLISEFKDETLQQREQIKKNIDFLQSTAIQQKNSFDASY